MEIDNHEELPSTVPLMALRGGILLPRSELQLPILDLRSLSAVSAAMREQRYLGVVQARFSEDELEGEEGLFRCGCLGQVVDIQDKDDEPLMLAIRGVCRFEVKEELPAEQNCRRATVVYEKYKTDLVREADFALDRYRLIAALKRYCKKLHMEPDWHELANISNERLVTMLMMICPFDSHEKQTLLETVSYAAQSRLMTSLIEMGALPLELGSPVYH